MVPERLQRRGKAAQAAGLWAEELACAALLDDGWTLEGRRLRNAGGEVDIVASRDGLVAFIEVKQRAELAGAALALGARQRARLLACAEILLAEHPAWGAQGVRFDVIVVDRQGHLRRIADAFRAGDEKAMQP